MRFAQDTTKWLLDPMGRAPAGGSSLELVNKSTSINLAGVFIYGFPATSESRQADVRNEASGFVWDRSINSVLFCLYREISFHSSVAYGPLSSAIGEVDRSACSAKVCKIVQYEANLHALHSRATCAKPQEPYGPGVSDNKVAFPTRTPGQRSFQAFPSEQCLTMWRVHSLAQICKAHLV